LNPKDYRWSYYSGICTTFTDPERGLACFERSAARRPDLDFVRLRAAELAIDLSRWEQAEPHVKAVLKRAPTDARANLASARLALAQGDLELARTRAEQSLASAPEVRATHEILAKISFQTQEKAAAERYLQSMKTATRNDDWPDPLLTEILQLRRDFNWELFRVQGYMDSGQTDLALSSIHRLADEYPESVELRLQWAQTLLSLGDKTEAAKVLDAGLAMNPRSARLHRMRGVLHYEQNEKTLAREHFQKAIELKPDYSLARYHLGKCLLDLGDQAGALREFQAAHALQPDLQMAKDEMDRLQSQAPHQ
jgi:tetratricopeptide (TPR) repeat protein